MTCSKMPPSHHSVVVCIFLHTFFQIHKHIFFGEKKNTSGLMIFKVMQDANGTGYMQEKHVETVNISHSTILLVMFEWIRWVEALNSPSAVAPYPILISMGYILLSPPNRLGGKDTKRISGIGVQLPSNRFVIYFSISAHRQCNKMCCMKSSVKIWQHCYA